MIRRAAIFPDDSAFTVRGPNGRMHLDPGYIYSRFQVGGVTVATWGTRWVLATGEDQYLETDSIQLRALTMRAGITLPDRPPVPAADRYANYVVLPLFILVLVTAAVIKFRAPKAQDPPGAPAA